MSNESNKAREQLKYLLMDLEGKKTKKALKQKQNIETYLKDEGEDLGKIKKEIAFNSIDKNKIPKHIYVKEDEYKQERENREIEEDGSILLVKNPIMLFIQIDKVNKHFYFKFMEETEKLETQCIRYPIFKYRPMRHGILPACDICYYGFTEANLFCEYMIKISRLAGYGFNGIQLNNTKWTLGKLE